MGSLLPNDAVLIPLTKGALLVSREHAIFCRVEPDDLAALQSALEGAQSDDLLSDRLRAELVRHGFGGPPRPQPPARYTIQLQLTNGCNLACSYCCTNSGPPRALEVTYAELVRVVDDARVAFGPAAAFSLLGGEPLLVPWALDLAEYIVDLGHNLTIFSNGTLLCDASLATRVAALMARGTEVRISLGSITRELCDTVSGAERYDHAIAGVHALANAGALPVVDVMLLPSQIDAVAEQLPVLRSDLPRDIRISLGVLYRSGREQGKNLFSSRAQLEAALDRIVFEAGETIAGPKASPLAERREACSCALGHHLHVRSDGALFTCFKMEEKVGHLREISFREGVEAVRRNVRPARLLPLCADCPLGTLCGGGCRSDNLQYTGDADRPACGPWRVRVLSELLAEDRPDAVEWNAEYLLAEAHARGIEAPDRLEPLIPSRHLVDR